MQNEVNVRPIEAQDYAVWREMWDGYNMFYGVAPPEAVTMATWTRILDASSPVQALLASDRAGLSLGFANYILHAYTWSDRPACLLDDLFVRTEARGQGVGHTLIEYLIQQARKQDWGRLYWMTREDNASARRLYDRFCKSDGFVRYTLTFEDTRQL